MTDAQLKALLAKAGWRLFYTYQNGEEEYTGPDDSDSPSLADIRTLVDLAITEEREACATICDELKDDKEFPEGWGPVSEACARLIRNRSKNTRAK